MEGLTPQESRARLEALERTVRALTSEDLADVGAILPKLGDIENELDHVRPVFERAGTLDKRVSALEEKLDNALATVGEIERRIGDACALLDSQPWKQAVDAALQLSDLTSDGENENVVDRGERG